MSFLPANQTCTIPPTTFLLAQFMLGGTEFSGHKARIIQTMKSVTPNNQFLRKLRTAYINLYPIKLALLENLRPRDMAVLLWVWGIKLPLFLKEKYLNVFRDLLWDTTWINPLVSLGLTLTLLGRDLGWLYIRLQDYEQFHQLYGQRKRAKVVLVATQPIAGECSWWKYDVCLDNYRTSESDSWVIEETPKCKIRRLLQGRLGSKWHQMVTAYDDGLVETRTSGFCDFPSFGVRLKAYQVSTLLERKKTKDGNRYCLSYLRWGSQKPEQAIEVEEVRRCGLSVMATQQDEEEHRSNILIEYKPKGLLPGIWRSILLLIPETT